MIVFTTIFLAETASSGTDPAEESIADYESELSLFEINRTGRERISTLETRNWFLEDLPSED
jgi:hypothetical protein